MLLDWHKGKARFNALMMAMKEDHTIDTRGLSIQTYRDCVELCRRNIFRESSKRRVFFPHSELVISMLETMPFGPASK